MSSQESAAKIWFYFFLKTRQAGAKIYHNPYFLFSGLEHEKEQKIMSHSLNTTSVLKKFEQSESIGSYTSSSIGNPRLISFLYTLGKLPSTKDLKLIISNLITEKQSPYKTEAETEKGFGKLTISPTIIQKTSSVPLSLSSCCQLATLKSLQITSKIPPP